MTRTINTLISGPAGPELQAWRLELSDYAKSEGLNWPRQLKMSSANHVENIKIVRFALNPKIDPKTFNPSK